MTGRGYLKENLVPCGADSTHSVDSGSQRHTKRLPLHSDTSRGGHEHTVQCRAEGSLELLKRQNSRKRTLGNFIYQKEKSKHVKTVGHAESERSSLLKNVASSMSVVHHSEGMN